MTQIKTVKPSQAYDILSRNRDAVLVDVRSKLEYTHVGHPQGAVHIVWKESPGWNVNPNFTAEVERAVPDSNSPVLLLCRSGQRSMDAAIALEKTGYINLINIDEGFEGPLDEEKHRGTVGGWRFHGLPWEQS